MEGIQVLQEALKIPSKDPEHLIVARALTEREEELPKQLQDHWDRLT